MLATMRQQSPAGRTFGSPVSAKLSWADLCEDSDSNEWEEDQENVSSRTTTPKSQDPMPHRKGIKQLDQIVNDSAWLGRTHSNISSHSNLSNTSNDTTDTMDNGSCKHPSPNGTGRSGKRGSRGGGGGGGHSPQLQPQQFQPQTQRSAQKRWSNNVNKGCNSSPQAGMAVAVEPQQQQTWPMAGFNMVPADFGTGSYSVVLEGVPLNLCNEVCLEAMLGQAGLQGMISKFDIERDTSNAASGGTATITLSHWQAAMRCYSHFATSRWSSGSLKVSMSQSPTNGNAGSCSGSTSPNTGAGCWMECPMEKTHSDGSGNEDGQSPEKWDSNNNHNNNNIPICNVYPVPVLLVPYTSA